MIEYEQCTRILFSSPIKTLLCYCNHKYSFAHKASYARDFECCLFEENARKHEANLLCFSSVGVKNADGFTLPSLFLWLCGNV